MSRNVFVIRPYHEYIRAQMLSTLATLGYTIPEGWVTDSKATDNDVIRQYSGKQADVLLLPYHGGKDREKKSTNGLQTLGRLIAFDPGIGQLPVLMPVSEYGAAGLLLQKSKYIDVLPMGNILFLEQRTLDNLDALLEACKDHLAE